MSDILREIDEELQREHMAKLWRKYQYVIVGVIALLVFGTASHSAWRAHKDQAEVNRSVALGSLGTDDSMKVEAKIESYQAFARMNQGTGQAVLAQMTAIGGLIHAKKTEEALKALDGLANDQTAPKMAQDYARVVRVELMLDTGNPVQLRQQLEPLAAEGQPWRFTARMMQGALFGKHGDHAKAKEIFKAISLDMTAPTTMRDEAKLLANYYATQG
jgi:hypothetical protein